MDEDYKEILAKQMSKVEKLNTENLELREKLIEYERDNCVVNSKVADFEKKIE